MPATPESRVRRHAERRALITAIKIDRGCVDCGYDAHPAALHFDHRDPTIKRFRIAANLSRRWADILDEIAKCDVRCANCHAIRTAEQGYGPGRPPRSQTPREVTSPRL